MGEAASPRPGSRRATAGTAPCRSAGRSLSRSAGRTAGTAGGAARRSSRAPRTGRGAPPHGTGPCQRSPLDAAEQMPGEGVRVVGGGVERDDRGGLDRHAV